MGIDAQTTTWRLSGMDRTDPARPVVRYVCSWCATTIAVVLRTPIAFDDDGLPVVVDTRACAGCGLGGALLLPDDAG